MKGGDTMGVIIGIIVSALGAHFYEIDFCTLYTFVSIGIGLFEFFESFV